MNTVYSCFATIISLLLLSSANAQDPPASLDALLKGAEIGTAWEQFQATHPEAEATWDEDTDDVTAEEHYGADPLLGLELYTSYGFRNGLLREYIFVWGAAPKKAEAARAKFLEAVIRRHGTSFKREVQRLQPTSENPAYAPALYWKTEAGHVLASYAETRSAAGRPIATLTYAVFPLEDPLIESQLVADELPSEQMADIWDALAEAMPEPAPSPETES